MKKNILEKIKDTFLHPVLKGSREESCWTRGIDIRGKGGIIEVCTPCPGGIVKIKVYWRKPKMTV